VNPHGHDLRDAVDSHAAEELQTLGRRPVLLHAVGDAAEADLGADEELFGAVAQARDPNARMNGRSDDGGAHGGGLLRQPETTRLS